MWHKSQSTELVPILDALCVKGRPVYIALDADFRKNPSVKRQMKALGEALEKKGCDVRICVWQYTEKTKGMDDFIANGGNFDEVIKTALTIAQWEKQFYNDCTTVTERKKLRKKEEGKEEKLSPIQKAEKAIESLDMPLRFNRLSKEVESQGKEVDADTMWAEGCKPLERYTSVDVFYRVLVKKAKEDSYHPVQEYLEGCYQKYGDDVGILNNMAKRYLGTNNPLHQVLLIKWLIGAVARAVEPGCKMDTALVLHGNQGIGKSTFFNILAGEWFTDSLDKLDSSNKDELLKAHQSWVIELAEIENAFSKTAISKIKQSMSAKTDQIRFPYGRKTEKCPRGFVICGTTNNPVFLNDPTGNRRFWVVSCNGRINRELLTQERDQIWAAAYSLWLKGEKWHLAEAEDKALAINNEEFESQDPWIDALLENVTGDERRRITTGQALIRIGVPADRQTPQSKSRMESCLPKIGYYKKRYRAPDGSRPYGWECEEFGVPNEKLEKSMGQMGQPTQSQSEQDINPVPSLSHLSCPTGQPGHESEQLNQDSENSVPSNRTDGTAVGHTQSQSEQGLEVSVPSVLPKSQSLDGNAPTPMVTEPSHEQIPIDFSAPSRGEILSPSQPSPGDQSSSSELERDDGDDTLPKLRVGVQVWVITPDGEKLEAIITHPQDEEEKWGLKVKIGAMEEDWNGTYYYPSNELELRE